jgi:hypothetical protein
MHEPVARRTKTTKGAMRIVETVLRFSGAPIVDEVLIKLVDLSLTLN